MSANGYRVIKNILKLYTLSELDLDKVIFKNSYILCTKNSDGTPFNTTQGKDFDNVWLM